MESRFTSKNRRVYPGEATVVAIILVILISVSTSALLMLYVFKEINTVKDSNPSQRIGSVMIESVEYASRDELRLVIKNIGTQDVVIERAYLFDRQHNYVGSMYPAYGLVTIPPKQSKEIIFTPNQPLTRAYYIVEVSGKGFSKAIAIIG